MALELNDVVEFIGVLEAAPASADAGVVCGRRRERAGGARRGAHNESS